MKIAVVIECEIQIGGGFQQELSTARILNKYRNQHYDFLFVTTKTANIEILRGYGIEAVLLHYRFIDKVRDRLHRLKGGISKPDAYLSPEDKFFRSKKIDLVYFLSPTPISLKLRAHNYIFTVWDLCHRDYVEFPEVNFGNEFEAREYLYSRALPKSIAVIVDSSLSRDNIAFRYGIDGKRVHILPFLPSIAVRTESSTDSAKQVDVRKKYSITGDYVFYPSQFWAHKNHVYILDALKVLYERGIKVHAVFSGSDKGNLDFVLGRAEELGIKELVRYLGFVDSNELPSLYLQSLALVMPTFFGPTNIPPLEAFAMGCPVCYSDLPGLREQVADAAFLMDLENPESLVNALTTIMKDKAVVVEKVQKGKQLLGQWTEMNYWNGVKKIFDSYAGLMRCWR